MGRVSDAEQMRRRRFVLDNYFSAPKSEMVKKMKADLGVDVSERALRNYYRWAENEFIHERIFDKDKGALRIQLQRCLDRYQKISDQAADDEARIRGRLKKRKIFISDCDQDTSRSITSLQYTQINAEKAIIQMLEKAGITAKREEIDINLKAEYFVIFGQAHMAVVYDLIPEDMRDIYVKRCGMFEGASFEYLQDVVEGKVTLPTIAEHIGGEEDGRNTDEEGPGS